MTFQCLISWRCSYIALPNPSIGVMKIDLCEQVIHTPPGSKQSKWSRGGDMTWKWSETSQLLDGGVTAALRRLEPRFCGQSQTRTGQRVWFQTGPLIGAEGKSRFQLVPSFEHPSPRSPINTNRIELTQLETSTLHETLVSASLEKLAKRRSNDAHWYDGFFTQLTITQSIVYRWVLHNLFISLKLG